MSLLTLGAWLLAVFLGYKAVVFFLRVAVLVAFLFAALVWWV